ncbi:MAG: hypothetical protein MUE32_08695 [Bacteroidales bacterium]|jgi:hypothetical protein|nr:hypothetical protein [Bacteroidales bacterium]
MGFASAYTGKGAIFPQFISETPDRGTGLIVVVPACQEPGITIMLDSLSECIEPVSGSEVIIVINSPPGSGAETRDNNRKTLNDIESWKNRHKDVFFRLFALLVEDPPFRKWGVGLARKTGMDEALRRFDAIDNPEGIIVNLDADCRVDKSYFRAIENAFTADKKLNACSIYFEHPLSGDEYPELVYRSIIQYELYLRYFVRALAFTGFPSPFHTVGSAIAVRALAYVRAGGMNRRQAGEDFYFIQKLIPMGAYFNLTTTRVIPSPRPSSRVPFGTGASITRMSSDKASVYETYSLEAFKQLRLMFLELDNLYSANIRDAASYYALLPQGLRQFIPEMEWTGKLIEIKMNTGDPRTFKKRFFEWFNMFQVVKYMNNVHRGLFRNAPVEKCSADLLHELGIVPESYSAERLLAIYRELDRKG